MKCKGIFNEKDIRKCRYYVRYVEKHARFRPEKFDWRNDKNNLEFMHRWLEKNLSGKYRDDDYYLIDEMIGNFGSDILPLDSFSWIYKNKRACFYIWYSFCVSNTKADDLFKDIIPRRSVNITNHDSRFDEIKFEFDALDCDCSEKNDLLDKYKKEILDDKINKIIPDDCEEKDITYLWNNLNKRKIKISDVFDSIENDEERKIAITGYYDCFIRKNDIDNAVFDKIKKGFNSQSSKRNIGDKQLLIRKETFLYLDEMARYYHVSKKDFIDSLILQKYDEFLARK